MRLYLLRVGRADCLAEEVECASSSLLRLRGLMLRASIPEGYALLIPLSSSKGSIHMLFMRFPIDLLLLDEHMRVVGIHTLKPWRGIVLFEGVRWAVEMREGRALEYGVVIGDALKLAR